MLLLHIPVIFVDLAKGKKLLNGEVVVKILLGEVGKTFFTHIKLFLFVNVLRMLSESREQLYNSYAVFAAS